MEPGRVLGLLLCGLSAGVAAVTRPSPAPATSGWTSEAAVPLRLVDGGHRCAGRVEVKHEGEWGSVCAYDFDWDARGAGVVCRQLGCGAAVRASPFAPFGQGEGRIWLHPFNCRGTEAALQDCYNFGWGRHFCGHEWDVGVTCAEALELRLAAGGGPCAGRVEVKLRGRWGTVADGAWSVEDAEVVCRQLGCGSAAGAYHGSKFGPAEGPINLVVVQCRGDEPALWNCSIQGWGPYDGHHDHDVAVVCQAYAGIRLADGGSPCAGRVEVEERGTWRPLCAESWELPDAHVLCRHLGCGPAVSVHPGGHFGVGKGPPVRCDEGARSLWRCPSAPWLLQSCGPAGVTYVACAEAGNDANAAGSPAPAVTGGGVPLPVAPVPVVLCALLGTLLSLALAALALQARRARARRAGPSRDAGSEAVYEELDYSQAPECREGLSRAGSVLQGSGLRLSPHLGDEEEGIGTAEALGAEYDDATAVPEETLGETGYDDVDIGAAGTSP
ncbi:scavenger receptor cysteine-rich domain-containing group B protein-like [Numida meleagris]|uniref:scavenger receptor cysteine-rich domain-containing group B protein-like n=1 Tax=Numida meleagris TaxID=8996 RepID=UPI000B3E3E73|nr:scavenger receptor cysteine-rich domain-containing group B protein-like [Numida meleagris]